LARHGHPAHKADFTSVPRLQLVRQLMRIQQQDMAKNPDIDLLRKNLTAMAGLVAQLQACGIQLGFLEMPTVAGLKELPGEPVPRQEIASAFPTSRFFDCISRFLAVLIRWTAFTLRRVVRRCGAAGQSAAG
jgi:hypothetical protein